ncbi:MAG: hypothetical protein K2X87_25525 [Gemmataceae bacterium]|nr:hypothetical protein [Gemmataceae bacterium]
MSEGKRYVGERTPDGCMVTVIDAGGERPLDPRYDLRNHSPDGYNFGYNGSGPSQLSLALLADALGDDGKAQDHYQRFKSRVVARLEGNSWELSQAEIVRAVAQIEAERGWSR